MYNQYNPNQIYTFICKSQKLAGYLMLFKNLKLLAVNPSREDENRNVFLFANTQILQDAVKEYKEWRNTNSNVNFNNKYNTNNTKTTSQRTTNTFKE